MKDVPIRASRLFASLLVFLPLLLAAQGDRWRRVAEKESKFAVSLAELHVRVGPDFAKLVSESVSGCDPIAYKMAGLDETQRQQITLYTDLLCAPWSDEWTKVFRACDRDPGPKWCEGDEEGEKHLQFHTYFDVMTQALHTTSDQLGRFNIMAVIAARLNDKIFRDFREAMVDGWVIPAASEFMKRATPDEVMTIAKALDASVYGYSKAIAAAFASHADKTPDFTEEQRDDLKKMAEHASVTR